MQYTPKGAYNMEILPYKIYWVFREEPILVAASHNQTTAIIIARELSQRNLYGYYTVRDSEEHTVYITKELVL